MKMSDFVSICGRSWWIGLIFALLLTACAGNQTDPSGALSAREAALGAQNELPKNSNQDPAAAALPDAAPVAQALGAGQPQAELGQPSAKAAITGPAVAPDAAAASLPEAISPAPAVDLSLPVEPRIGARAPEITLQTLDGQTVNLSRMLGRPVVVSYWSTWCVPCKQELPILQRLSEEYADRGLVVLTVNATDQDDMEQVQAMVSELGMTFPVLLDEAKAFASGYNAMFFPSTFFIDASGVIREIKLGDSTEADLRTKIENLLAVQ